MFIISFFHVLHLKISECLQILYFHGLKLTNLAISDELNVTQKSVGKVKNKAYESLNNESHVYVFSDLGSIIDESEVDETHAVSRRDDRGRIVLS